MARTATTVKKPAAKGAAAKGAAAKGGKPAAKDAARSAVKDGDLDELSALAATAKELEDTERAKTGGNSLFITLVQGNSSILAEGDPRYLKGVKMHDYVIAQNKLRLGATLDATVIGVFKLYEEKARREKDNEMAPTVGFWMPEQAEQVPLGEGEIFARPLTNGNILMPVHWVFLYLHDHPEIEGAMLSFRSTGNKVYDQLRKLLKAETRICTELRFTIGKQGIRNENFKKTNFYPEFNVSGRNFDYVNNRVVPIKGGLDAGTLKVILQRSKEIQEDYASCRLVAKRGTQTLAALIGAQEAVRALPAVQGEEDDGDHETTSF
jgi:hypothetical protein